MKLLLRYKTFENNTVIERDEFRLLLEEEARTIEEKSNEIGLEVKDIIYHFGFDFSRIRIEFSNTEATLLVDKMVKSYSEHKRIYHNFEYSIVKIDVSHEKKYLNRDEALNIIFNNLVIKEEFNNNSPSRILKREIAETELRSLEELTNEIGLEISETNMNINAYNTILLNLYIDGKSAHIVATGPFKSKGEEDYWRYSLELDVRPRIGAKKGSDTICTTLNRSEIIHAASHLPDKKLSESYYEKIQKKESDLKEELAQEKTTEMEVLLNERGVEIKNIRTDLTTDNVVIFFYITYEDALYNRETYIKVTSCKDRQDKIYWVYRFVCCNNSEIHTTVLKDLLKYIERSIS